MLVAQLSDIHLDDAAALARLDRVLDWLRTLAPHAIAVSGDLANHTHLDNYTLLKQRFDTLGVPVLVVPGNVDSRSAMREVFGGPADGPLNRTVTLDGIRLIGLDVTVPGAVHGDAAPVVNWLRAELAASPMPALIFLHQHPFASGLDDYDTVACRNSEQLAEVIAEANGKVLGISCGHLHRPTFTRFAGIPATLAPAVGKPLALVAEGHKATSNDPPGLLVHHLHQSGLITHLVSLGD